MAKLLQLPTSHSLRLLKLISVYTASVGGVWFGVAFGRQLVFATSFDTTQQKTLKSLLHSVPFNVQLQFLSEPTDFATDALALLKDIYDGKNTSPFLSLATAHLSKYMQRVLEVTALIPVGCVASYGAVAEVAGGSARAVGNVMAANPFAPVVPCHRVVGAGFKLGGYSNLQVKREILTREKRGFAYPKEITVGNRKLHVFPVEFVLRKLE